jgi:single-stranded-DNA-specific exonuclease
MQLERSIVARDIDDIPDYGDDVHPVLARVYAARQVSSREELARGLDKLPSYAGLKGIEAAVTLLADAIRHDKSILILADFDADGATSCAVAMLGLRALGARQVDFLVPNRFEYGYGLTPEIARVAAQRQPDLLVTVDNGISSIKGVTAAKQHGMQVLITDHHLPGESLPAADAIVNPNQPGDTFISKNLAGVGVMFYTLMALRAELREQGWFQQQNILEPNLAKLLDLVALGTVADVVPLDYINRILVEQGLRRIRAGRCRPGILALLQLANRNASNVVAADLGFAVGPRLNAAGRLEDMSRGIECLLAADADRAMLLATELDQLNRERRSIEADMQTSALAILRELSLDDADNLPAALCLFDEHWHQGVVGLLASRIKERLHRPVIAFAPGEQGELKGSARSIPGLHIRDALDAVAARQPQLLSRFGGHAMAAGLSLERDKLAAFTEAFITEVSRHLDSDDLQGVIHSDGELEDEFLNLEVAEHLRQGGPWGQGFPEPVFHGRFRLISHRIVGEHHLKLQLALPQQDQILDAIAFNTVKHDWPDNVREVEIAYRLDVNEFRGTRSAQLLVEHLRPCDSGQ